MRASSAVNAVLNTAELVIMICDYLDELSLVRVQCVSRIWRDLVRGTTMFRRRLCINDGEQEVLDTRTQDAFGIHFNPLLDWFTTRSFMSCNHKEGPSQECGRFITLQYLPSARHASSNGDSLVHKLLVTNKPVRYLNIHGRVSGGRSGFCPSSTTKTVYSKAGPLTIGRIFKFCRYQAPTKYNSSPFALEVPDPISSYDFHGKLMIEFRKEWDGWFNNVTPNMMTMYSFRMDCKYGLYKKLRKEWFKITSRDDWHTASRGRQSDVMAEMMGKQRAIAKSMAKTKKYLDVEPDLEYPAWPALAWKAKNEESQTDEKGLKDDAPYEVDYAGGLVFNRQD